MGLIKIKFMCHAKWNKFRVTRNEISFVWCEMKKVSCHAKWNTFRIMRNEISFALHEMKEVCKKCGYQFGHMRNEKSWMVIWPLFHFHGKKFCVKLSFTCFFFHFYETRVFRFKGYEDFFKPIKNIYFFCFS